MASFFFWSDTLVSSIVIKRRSQFQHKLRSSLALPENKKQTEGMLFRPSVKERLNESTGETDILLSQSLKGLVDWRGGDVLSTFPFCWVSPVSVGIYLAILVCDSVVFCVASASLHFSGVFFRSLHLSSHCLWKERDRWWLHPFVVSLVQSARRYTSRKCVCFIPTPNGVYRFTHTPHILHLHFPSCSPLNNFTTAVEERHALFLLLEFSLSLTYPTVIIAFDWLSLPLLYSFY